jgi:hypothetical protein
MFILLLSPSSSVHTPINGKTNTKPCVGRILHTIFHHFRKTANSGYHLYLCKLGNFCYTSWLCDIWRKFHNHSQSNSEECDRFHAYPLSSRWYPYGGPNRQFHTHSPCNVIHVISMTKHHQRSICGLLITLTAHVLWTADYTDCPCSVDCWLHWLPMSCGLLITLTAHVLWTADYTDCQCSVDCWLH